VSARFRRARGGGATVAFEAEEALLLRRLLGELLTLVGEAEEGGDAAGADPLAELVGIGTHTTTPEDPVLARLFPDAYPDDPEAAGDFRRYTEPELRRSKTDAVRTALRTLGEGRLRLSADEAGAWLRALNDLRLAIGTRLEVTEEWGEVDDTLPDPDDPRRALYTVYLWLGWLQETLVGALARHG
jgi:Domain of unknown function (DUF2017)